ncbi:MAG: helix-turn-helix transcriptional regulator [Opitutae bacterium]|nr:helix-turn-helix transcriptional regulator [Opitutae bacterium]
MDLLAKNMDFLTKHWAPYARRHPAQFPLVSADFISEKNHWIRTTFDTCNFSLILRGRGEYHRAGRTWPVQAPCVITQWPGEPVSYGPPLPKETWDELYFVYDRKHFAGFRRIRLIDPERPIWPIADPAAVQAQIAEFAALARRSDPEAVVDRVDRLAERIVLETWLAPSASTRNHGTIQRIAAAMRSQLAAPESWRALPARHGLSSTTFRRRWCETMGEPPARYLLRLRLREACRLLVESDLPIHEIATAVGFADEFYFSRRFRLAIGQPPRDYRKTYRLRRGPQS